MRLFLVIACENMMHVQVYHIINQGMNLGFSYTLLLLYWHIFQKACSWNFFSFWLSRKGWERDTRVATPLREEGLPTAIACSASEPVLSIEGAKLTRASFQVTLSHGKVVCHHSPTKVQAERMVPNRFTRTTTRKQDSNSQTRACGGISPSHHLPSWQLPPVVQQLEL